MSFLLIIGGIIGIIVAIAIPLFVAREDKEDEPDDDTYHW